MPSLIELTQDERDALLSTFVFIDKPKYAAFPFSLKKPDEYTTNVINYSQIMTEIDENDSYCPHPSSLKNGDVLRFGDHRGIGTMYVLWLKKGLLIHSPEDLLAKKQAILDGGPGPAAKRFRKNAAVEQLSLESDFPLDCYLFSHPDEWGYVPSPIVSSQPPDLYDKVIERAEGMMYFDPLLTVSTSFYGKMYVDAKKSDEWKDNDQFPFQYIGVYNGDEVEWFPIEESSNQADVSEGFFENLRDLFNKHFF